jgi:hypothetical protein
MQEAVSMLFQSELVSDPLLPMKPTGITESDGVPLYTSKSILELQHSSNLGTVWIDLLSPNHASEAVSKESVTALTRMSNMVYYSQPMLGMLDFCLRF